MRIFDKIFEDLDRPLVGTRTWSEVRSKVDESFRFHVGILEPDSEVEGTIDIYDFAGIRKGSSTWIIDYLLRNVDSKGRDLEVDLKEKSALNKFQKLTPWKISLSLTYSSFSIFGNLIYAPL